MSNVITQLRIIAADMLDVSEIEFDYTDVAKIQQSLRRFSTQLDALSDELDKDRIANAKDLADAERWRLMADPEIRVEKRSQHFSVFRDYHDREGNRTGTKLVATGPTLLHALNKALGYPN